MQILSEKYTSCGRNWLRVELTKLRYLLILHFIATGFYWVNFGTLFYWVAVNCRNCTAQDWETEPDRRGFYILAILTIITVYLSGLFGDILMGGVKYKQNAEIKWWLAYYVVTWIGTCISLAYVAPMKAIVVLVPAFGLICAWTVANILLDIQKSHESQSNASAVNPNRTKSTAQLKPSTIKCSESTYLLITTSTGDIV